MPSSPRVGQRLLIVVAVAVGAVVGVASPTLAHGRGSDATNFASTLVDVPALHAITWEVYGGDEYLSVTNRSDRELIVLGYGDVGGGDEEPYLRIGPDGVFENRKSPATYLSAERYARTTVPEHADASAQPEWVKVSDATSYAWHDHRIHHMGMDAAMVVPDPSTETLVHGWEVPFIYDGERHAVVGELRWVPGPSPWPWLLVSLALVVVALVGLRSEPAAGRWPGLARPAAAVLAAIVVLNVAHLVDDVAAVPLPPSATLLAAGQTALFLMIGAFGTVRAWQAEEAAFTALGVGSGAILVGQGLLYASVLGASQVTSVFPDALARLTVALSITQALPLGVVAVIGTRRLLPPRSREREAQSGERA